MTEKEFGERLKNDQDYFEFEIGSKMGRTILKLKAVGKVAWGAIIVALTAVVGLTIATIMTGGTAAPITALIATPTMVGAVAILGPSVTASAIAIAVAGGSIDVLNKLRECRNNR